MIPRYSTSDMEYICSTKNKYKIWLEIETLACEAMEKYNQIPKGTTKIIRENQTSMLIKYLKLKKRQSMMSLLF